jgi:hypothetical protein
MSAREWLKRGMGWVDHEEKRERIWSIKKENCVWPWLGMPRVCAVQGDVEPEERRTS